MLLENKNAVIYGGAGTLGEGIGKAFASEGARVFLTGRTRETLEKVASEIIAAGGRAEVAVVDALDERAVDEHAAEVAATAGSLDVSVNLVPRGDVQGIPLVEMSTADVTRAVINGLTSNFVTARAAARHMIDQGSGVILALDSGSAQGTPMMGSTCLADAAIDSFIRGLAKEIGPNGIRALGMWIAGVPESLTPEKIGAVNPSLADPATLQGVLDNLAALRLTRRSPRLAEIAATAAFLASDRAAGITGTWVNATAMVL